MAQKLGGEFEWSGVKEKRTPTDLLCWGVLCVSVCEREKILILEAKLDIYF